MSKIMTIDDKVAIDLSNVQRVIVENLSLLIKSGFDGTGFVTKVTYQNKTVLNAAFRDIVEAWRKANE